jgi:hypothetical protein
LAQRGAKRSTSAEQLILSMPVKERPMSEEGRAYAEAMGWYGSADANDTEAALSEAQKHRDDLDQKVRAFEGGQSPPVRLLRGLAQADAAVFEAQAAVARIAAPNLANLRAELDQARAELASYKEWAQPQIEALRSDSAKLHDLQRAEVQALAPKERLPTMVKTWHYFFPNTRQCSGWAEIVLTSTGMFAATSDYGNYAYAWRSTGCIDFREFVARLADDPDYFMRKVGHEDRVFDEESTVRLIKETICSQRRDGSITRAEAREEWNRLRVFSQGRDEFDFAEWHQSTELSDAGEYFCKKFQSSLVAFAEKILPKLADAIRKEIDAECAVLLDPSTPETVVDETLRTMNIDPEALAESGRSFVRSL